MAVVYIVKSGALCNTKQEYNLSPYYFSSLKKALAVKKRILKDNLAENIKPSFDGEPIYKSLIESTDYIGENGKYNGRVLIEKEIIW